MRVKFNIFVWVAIGAFFFSVSTVHAQEPSRIDLTLSPITLRLYTDPGQSIPSSFKVRNNGTQPEHLVLNLAKFTSDETGSKPVLIEFLPDDPEQYWLHFAQKDFVVQPNDWCEINLVFDPPPEAALDYYYAIILNRARETLTIGQNQITGAPAILALVQVQTPNATKQLDLVSFKPTKRFYEYLPTEFEVKVRNSGNVYLIPKGNIYIEQKAKHEIGIIDVNTTSSAILPGTERNYPSTWEDGFPVTITSTETQPPKSSTQWDFTKINHFRIGRFTAHLLLVYDVNGMDIPVEADTSFWVLPWKIMLGGLVIGLILLAGLWSILRSFWKKLTKKK